ncbi:MAG: hypothetical protein H6834_14385 [Planctomycetes bacterium]|nr:hypothetical protein [Planctomycetota bacterium]MCB9891929.1 hypothetical protein [Planctomycetota bacterium]
MSQHRIFLALVPVSLFVLWFLTQPEVQDENSPDLESAADRTPGRGSTPSTVERRPEEGTGDPTTTDPENALDQAEALRALLGFQGVAEVSVRDVDGRPVEGIPVAAIPEATWRMLSMDPDRPETYLENLRLEPSVGIPLTNALGEVRLEVLPVQKELVALAGSSEWMGGGAFRFESGSAANPARVEVTVHRKASLEVRARDPRGTALQIIALVIAPDASLGYPERRIGLDAPRPAMSHTCSGLPAKVPLTVRAHVMLNRKPTVLTGSITLDPDAKNLLELTL